MIKTDITGSRIMIVDDSTSNLALLGSMLREQGYSVHPFLNGKQALDWASNNMPDLILLDIVMPDMDGYKVCECLKDYIDLCDIPVIFISSENDIKSKMKAFDLGCVDYITKPFESKEVHTRIKTHLRLRNMQVQLENKNNKLEAIVFQTVKEMMESWKATILAMAKLSESRDDDTGKHLERVQALCKALAEHLSKMPEYSDVIDNDFIDNIYHTSPLHDIGKVGIPDRILLKPGKLDREEFELIKQHTIIGAQTLETVRKHYPGNIFIEMGISIARSHHERWDGKGYPDGLAGSDIPLCARIMAVADVYDALRSNRSYKKAMPHDKAVSIILEGKGIQFDPAVIDAFLRLEKIMISSGIYTMGPASSEAEIKRENNRIFN